jgi:hypothetical protein
MYAADPAARQLNNRVDPKALWKAWRALWSGKCDARPLACYRMVWAAAACLQMLSDGNRAGNYSSGLYHVPLLPWVAPIEAEQVETLARLSIAAAACAFLGIFARWAIALFVGLQGYLFVSDLLLFRNHVYLLLLTGCILALSPCDDVWSLSRWLIGQRSQSRSRFIRRWPSQMIKGQMLVVYAWAALNKLNGAFLSGWVLETELAYFLPKSLIGALLELVSPHAAEGIAESLTSPAVSASVAIVVVLLELIVGVGLAIPRTRRMAVFLGMGLHLGIALTMNVFVFTALMLGSYVLFLPPRRWNGT